MALQREPDRLYPQPSLAAHVVGYTDVDGKGNAGIEQAFDEQLSDPEHRGKPITLSISSRQQALEHEQRGDDPFLGDRRGGVIMDIQRRIAGDDLAAPAESERGGAGNARGAVQSRDLGVYELGSTFKPFTIAMAMDAGVIKSFGQIYNCPNALHVAGRTINDTHPFGRACSVAEIMKESSNIGTAQIADQLDRRQKSSSGRWVSSTRSMSS